LQDILDIRLGQCGNRWPAVREGLEIGPDGLNRRLLQHDLGQPDAVGIARLPRKGPPWQASTVTVVPGQEIAGVGTLDRLYSIVEHAASSHKTSAMQRPRSARPLSDLVRPALADALKAQGFAAAEILHRWPEIVGDRLAGHSLPVRILWPPR